MLKSIEEKVDEQWVQEQKQHYTYKGFQEKLTVQDNILNYSIEVNWDQSSESGKYTSEEFELCSAQLQWERIKSLELVGDKLREQFQKEAITETLAEAVRNTPNDQELGSAIREWYNRTEGKFI